MKMDLPKFWVISRCRWCRTACGGACGCYAGGRVGPSYSPAPTRSKRIRQSEFRRDYELFLWAVANDKKRAKRSPFNLVCYEQLVEMCMMAGWKQTAELTAFAEASTRRILGSQLVEDGFNSQKNVLATRTAGGGWRHPSRR